MHLTNKAPDPESSRKISRKDFLSLIGVTLGALIIPPALTIPGRPSARWPELESGNLPPEISCILNSTPETTIDSAGYLQVHDPSKSIWSAAHVEPTLWNIENSTPRDRLKNGMKWGIVLHWFGDTERNNLDLSGFMRGFNGLRRFEDIETPTSAHFLVGAVHPLANHSGSKISIVQTQKPDIDGHPFAGAHIRSISHQKLLEGKQYFINAMNNLSYEGKGFQSLLQTYYDGSKRDLNKHTLGIEITGSRFDADGYFPSQQKVANVLSVVISLMKRYMIPAANILGHLEIQMNKPDPGKKFMALIRYLVGIQALVEENEQLKQLVFGNIYRNTHDKTAAVIQYFEYVREYLMLISTPGLVHNWEKISKYWFFRDELTNNHSSIPLTGEFCFPISGDYVINGYDYLDPPNHEGVDIHYPIKERGYNSSGRALIRLIANGRCLYYGEVKDCHHGKLAIFLHRQPDGTQFLSVYGHLSGFHNLTVGGDYPMGYLIGHVNNNGSACGNFLHFAIAYGALWDETLSKYPTIPLNGGPYWIKQRYFHPLEFLSQRITQTNDMIILNKLHPVVCR